MKIFGSELGTLQKTANAVEQVMARVKGIEDLGVFDSLGQPTLNIVVDRKRAARYGLMPGRREILWCKAAIGGQPASGNLYEAGSERNFPIVVRLKPQYRGSLDAIEHITVNAPNPNGSGTIPVPLSDVADMRLTDGASQIYRENQERYVPVKYSVRGRDLGGAVLEAQDRVAKEVRLPSGIRLEWSGELSDLHEAVSRLTFAVPASLFRILVLLYCNFGSLREALLAASVLPLALIGGIFALFLTHTPLSVSGAIGFIALFGISIMNGIIVVGSFNEHRRAGMIRITAIRKACEQRLATQS